jgi:hypothetical protein
MASRRLLTQLIDMPVKEGWRDEQLASDLRVFESDLRSCNLSKCSLSDEASDPRMKVWGWTGRVDLRAAIEPCGRVVFGKLMRAGSKTAQAAAGCAARAARASIHRPINRRADSRIQGA